jgi:hypothetical protein
MVLPVDFRAFLQCLHRRRVRFLVGGAHALAAHGRPRYTGDLDVLIEPTALNAKRGIVVRLGRPPVGRPQDRADLAHLAERRPRGAR